MIDLPPNALEALNRLFAKYVPYCEVRAFGSRVKWTSKDYSDLDLAIVCDAPIERKLFNRLQEEIEELPTNFRVDLLDWHKISPQFQKIIEEHYEVIYKKGDANGID
jgi:predicted nucleotidyltransferase